MSTATNSVNDTPVRKSVTVRAGAERAFQVFTSGIGTWWPKSHHIGKVLMTRAVIESRLGGRCYSEQEDGSICPWGEITVWDPPRRFVMAWKISARWEFEPDNRKSSEVEVLFTPQEDGTTRVDLEHRRFDRMPTGGDTMRTGVDSPGGWTSILELFAAEAERPR